MEKLALIIIISKGGKLKLIYTKGSNLYSIFVVSLAEGAQTIVCGHALL